MGAKSCSYYPNGEDIIDLVRERKRTKFNAKLLISRLKQWDLLDDGFRMTLQRKKASWFFNVFAFQSGFVLLEAIEIPCNTSN